MSRETFSRILNETLSVGVPLVAGALVNGGAEIALNKTGAIKVVEGISPILESVVKSAPGAMAVTLTFAIWNGCKSERAPLPIYLAGFLLGATGGLLLDYFAGATLESRVGEMGSIAVQSLVTSGFTMFSLKSSQGIYKIHQYAKKKNDYESVESDSEKSPGPS
jgi:hypothetical protein